MSPPNVINTRELIEIYYGTKIQTVPQESDFTVGTSAVKLGANANIRTAIIISNAGAATIALGFSINVTATHGVQLAAGGSVFFTWNADGEIASCDIWAISASAGNSVHVVEYVLRGL